MVYVIDGVLVFNEIIVLIISVAMLTAVFYNPYLGFLISIAVALSFGNETLLSSKVGFMTLIDTSLIVNIFAFIKHQFFTKKKVETIASFASCCLYYNFSDWVLHFCG